MYAPPCSCRTGTNWIEELARDSLRSSVSSPGIPNTYRTPSASRHSTNTSEALRSAAMISRYLTATTEMHAPVRRPMRVLSALLALGAALVLAAPAAADGTFQIDGGGNGHGIGMSQYGAYGYALHGKRYRFILSHYYRGTQLRSTNPRQITRVLLADGSASFSGASYAPHKRLDANRTYSVQALADGSLALYDQKGRKVGTFRAPLSVGGPGPLRLAGRGLYRGWLEFRPAGSGAAVQTVNALHLED